MPWVDADLVVDHERAPTRGARSTNCLISRRFVPVKGKGPSQGAPLTNCLSLGVMAWGGRPQGAPLPIVFSRRYGRRRAPTRGAPTDCLFSALWPGEGTHKGRPYRRAPTRGAPTDCLLSALWPGEGAHKGRPYRLSSLGVMAGEGRPQGAPLPIVFLSALWPGKGAHKGRPYRLSFLGVMAWGGHPQGAPLPIVFSRRYGLGKGAHKGRPYRLSFLGVMAWEGPTRGVFSRRYGRGRAPTRGAPTDCLLSALWPGKGAHKGRPYQLSFLGVMAWGGHPQGAPLPIVFSRRYGLGRAPTRGAPTDCLFSALWPGKGAHKGRPYRLSFLGVMAWGGHPQGAPLPIVFSRRYGLGRAPTRGAPTDCLFSALWPGKGTHKGRPYRLSFLGVMAGEGRPQGRRPYRLSFLGVMAWEGHPQGAPLPIVFSRRYGRGRAPTRGAPTDCLLSAPTRGAPTDCLFSALWPGEGAHKGRPYLIQAASRGFF